MQSKADRKKYMHMIVQYFLCIDLKARPLGNLLKNPLQSLCHSLTKDHPPILGDLHRMIFEIVNGASGSLETQA
jgi:hypothetical protein